MRMRTGACVCVSWGCTGTFVAPAVFIARPRRADGHVCFCVVSLVVRMRAAGATWTLVIASAPWAARSAHTTVIDAAGAIYVLGGGTGGSSYFNDVWKSSDRGVDQT